MSEVRKFKCINSYKSGEWLTKGKVYEYKIETADFGRLFMDDGYSCPLSGEFMTCNSFEDKPWSYYLKDVTMENVSTEQNKYKNIDHVTFNNPATIVHFSDGTKIVVKTTKNDKYNPTTGFLYAYFEKMSGMSKTQCSKFFDKLESDYVGQMEIMNKKLDKKNKVGK